VCWGMWRLINVSAMQRNLSCLTH